jgi:hypothetical protein
VIIFDLKCGSQGHVFEGWFASSLDFDDQQSRGLVSCPLCACPRVSKAPMAPSVPAKANARRAEPSTTSDLFSAAPTHVKAMLAAAAAVQKKLLAGSEGVGDRFADEARAIHFGEADARPIHGRASRDEARALIEDGVEIAPLPFPVPDPAAEN